MSALPEAPASLDATKLCPPFATLASGCSASIETIPSDACWNGSPGTATVSPVAIITPMIAIQLDQTNRAPPQDRRPRICLPPAFRAPPPLACTGERVRANRGSAGAAASYHAGCRSIVRWSESERVLARKAASACGDDARAPRPGVVCAFSHAREYAREPLFEEGGLHAARHPARCQLRHGDGARRRSSPRSHLLSSEPHGSRQKDREVAPLLRDGGRCPTVRRCSL